MHEEVKHPREGAHMWPEGPGRDRGPPRGQETPRRDKGAVGWRPPLGLVQEGTCSGTRPRGEVLPSAPPHLSEGLGVVLLPPGETHILELGQPRSLCFSPAAPQPMPAPQPDPITCSAAPPLLRPSCFALHDDESVWGTLRQSPSRPPSVPPCRLLSPQPHNVLRSRTRF